MERAESAGQRCERLLGRSQVRNFLPLQGESNCPPHRSKDIEASGFNGTAAFMEVRVQSIVVEFILTHVDRLFGDTALCGECPPAQHVTTVWGVPAELQGPRRSSGSVSHFADEKTESQVDVADGLMAKAWRWQAQPLLLSMAAARSLAHRLALKISDCRLIPLPTVQGGISGPLCPWDSPPA